MQNKFVYGWMDKDNKNHYGINDAQSYSLQGCPSHSILVFYDKDKVYWFEPMFNDISYYYSGIHEYESILELLEDFKKTFIENLLIKNLIPTTYDSNNIQLYKYEKPKAHINGYEMRNHINNSIQVKIFERKTL